jgi:hypothetical protein
MYCFTWWLVWWPVGDEVVTIVFSWIISVTRRWDKYETWAAGTTYMSYQAGCRCRRETRCQQNAWILFRGNSKVIPYSCCRSSFCNSRFIYEPQHWKVFVMLFILLWIKYSSVFEFIPRRIKVRREKTIECLCDRSVVQLNGCWYEQRES